MKWNVCFSSIFGSWSEDLNNYRNGTLVLVKVWNTKKYEGFLSKIRHFRFARRFERRVGGSAELFVREMVLVVAAVDLD